MSPMLVKTLAKKGLIETPSIWKPRPRVWMRTDDVEKAVETLATHYGPSEVMEALSRKFSISSIEYYVDRDYDNNHN